MNRRCTWTLALLLVGCAAFAHAQEEKKPEETPKPAKDAKPIIPDKGLEAAVRKMVYEKRNNDKPLTAEDLGKVFILKGTGLEIKNLTGLEKCANLLELNLSNNAIIDLKPLAALENLQSLDLSKNKISDLTPLAKLKKLQYLELSGNQAQKIDALADLTKLSALYLSGNKISALKPLAKLSKLSSLYLDGNQLSDVAPLASVTRLSTLDLTNNQIVDLAPLEKQTQLGMLLLRGNKLTDLGPLVKLCQADAEGDRRIAPFLRLYLAGNPLGDAAKKQLEQLKGFGVRVNLAD